MRLRKFLPAIGLAVALAAGAPAAPAATLFSVGAGDVGGGYYAAMRAICRQLNRVAAGELRCSPESTAGSVYNLAALRDGQIDFALVQSDWHRLAWEGDGPFAGAGPMVELRSVMSLYPETVTLLAREDSGIETTADLAGTRIDIGVPASGRRATAVWLFERLGLGEEDFADIYELPSGSALAELCAGRIDATLLVLGHPNAGVAAALESCGATLVPVRGPALDLSDSPDYRAAEIPRGVYPSVLADVPSFSVTATLVTLARTDPATVERLTFETLRALRSLGTRTPLLAGADPASMRTEGLSAPLHPGAEAAFAAFFAGE